MVLRTSLEFEVPTGEMQASVSMLSKYHDVIRKSSSEWAKYGTTVSQSFKIAKQANRQIGDYLLIADHAAVSGVKFGAAARVAGSMFTKLARDAKSVSESLASSALSLLEVFSVTGAIAGLIGLGGGLFGLEAGARSVTERRRGALGLDAEYGRVSAFDLNFSRYGDAQGILGGVARGLFDATSPAYVGLLASGASTRGDAAQTSVELLRKLPGLFRGTPDEMIGPRAESLGLTQIMSVREIVAYLKSTPEERRSQLEHYEADSHTLTLSRDSQDKWARFDTALSRAGLSIETVLAEQLSSLADPLSKLSDAAVNIIGAFSKSPVIGRVLYNVEEDLKWLADDIGSDPVRAKADAFLRGIVQLGSYIVRAFETLERTARTSYGVYDYLTHPGRTVAGEVDRVVGPASVGAPRPSSFGAGTGAPSIRYGTRARRESATGTHGVDQRDPNPGVWYGSRRRDVLGIPASAAPVPEDPGIRARRVQKQQTVSYLDQFQGLRTQKNVVVSDQTHGSVQITQGAYS